MEAYHARHDIPYRPVFGMSLVGETLFVANTDGVMRFPYKEGQIRIESPGEMILPLPAGGYNNHWTRNILASRDSRKLFVTVGSASNAGEYGLDTEIRRANILEINLDGRANGSSPPAFVTRTAWPGSRLRGRSGRW